MTVAPKRAAATMAIDDIKVRKRHRRDLGDIQPLAESIAEVGLLHPVVVTPERVLIAGARRIEAWKTARPGEPIPVRVVDLAPMRGEFAENAFRKDFTPSEAVAIKRALEPIERAEAKQRQRRHGETAPRRNNTPENFSDVSGGNALDKVARGIGFHRTTIAKAEAIVDAATAEPEKFGKLLDAMDRTGRVNGPYRRLRNTKQAEAIRAAPPPLPGKGPYNAGMVDLPWAYEPDDDNTPRRGVLPYSTLSIEQACALEVNSTPVRELLAEDFVLGMWVTNFVLARGLHLPVLRAWGELEAKSVVTWPKDRPGRGHWVKGQTEHLVIAARGKPLVTLTNQTTLMAGPFHLVRKNEHSAKPVEAYAYFESLYPAPRYFDLFSRYQHNDRWDLHGFEAPLTKEAAE
jgi:N6-adenosine-specific RNA methylase IME4